METRTKNTSTRYDRLLEGVGIWGSYYRENPDEFVEDYLHITLKRFQRILIVMMFYSIIFVFIACRGIGKTFLAAIYCVVRCILYPKSKICIASGTRGQAINVLEKIMLELKPRSPELCAEIDEKETKVNGADAKIIFKNGSFIKVVTAKDSARGNRCNILLLDEYRLIDKDAISTVLRKFLTSRRTPEYKELTDEEKKKAYEKEKNLTLYLSSAYFKDHWSYTKCVDTFKNMLDPERHQFLCGFPYQLSIEEGILDPSFVEDEMLESDFSDIVFNMEMGAEWYGSAEGAFFDFDSISKNRKIKYPMLPSWVDTGIRNASQLKIPAKEPGEIRILSGDIALMSSKKVSNDATSIFLNRLLPTKSNRYVSNFVYTETHEGLRTDNQALIIRKLFDEYQCDYLVLDASGVGLGVYDMLAKDISDPETGQIYPALSCCNNTEMAERCVVPGAQKAIWVIKASAQFNSECAFLLREGFRSGFIRLLCNEYDAETFLSEIKGYASLSPAEKNKIKLIYVQTTLLVDELVNLQHEESGGKIRIFEKSGRRKDRYSSLSYNYYVATKIANKITKKNIASERTEEMFVIKAPKSNGKAVGTGGGYSRKQRRETWQRNY